jgi:hypothetical protein
MPRRAPPAALALPFCVLPFCALPFCALAQGAPAGPAEPLSPFARNVVLHVLLHEGGHAAIQDFGLPVLSNEEDMADAFAAAAIIWLMDDRAEAILKDRARSWMVETEERGWPGDGPDPFEDPYADIWGEHRLDAQRAFDAMCFLYGANSAERAGIPEWFGMSENDAGDCADRVPDILGDWLEAMSPHLLPEGEVSPLVEVLHVDGPLVPALRASGVAEEAAAVLARLRWAEPVTIVVDGCDGGAWWDDEARGIILCDAYAARFVAQEALAVPR